MVIKGLPIIRNPKKQLREGRDKLDYKSPTKQLRIMIIGSRFRLSVIYKQQVTPVSGHKLFLFFYITTESFVPLSQTFFRSVDDTRF